ncbi:MAG: hypothetical protein K8F33_05275, partial [Thermomonas sp.]|uniref:hypothetical protein n=1 Tax=Thermomonas sp. TaxID=1971895 RepID=UPI001D86BAD6
TRARRDHATAQACNARSAGSGDAGEYAAQSRPCGHRAGSAQSGSGRGLRITLGQQPVRCAGGVRVHWTMGGWTCDQSPA